MVRRALGVAAAAVLTIRAALGCSSFGDGPTGDADASTDAAPVPDGSSPDGSGTDGASPPLDAGSDATVYRFAADGGGDFLAVGSGPFEWLDEQGKPFVRISGLGTFEHAVPFMAKRMRLSFRVRVLSGPDGGNPYINTAGLTVGADFPDAGNLLYSPRVLQQASTIELGCEELPGGVYRSTSRAASPTVWANYTLSYQPSNGQATLSSQLIADANLPFSLVTNVTSIVARAGALGPDHVVDLADLELVIE